MVAANVVVAVVMAKVEVVLDVLGCSPQNWHLNFFFATATNIVEVVRHPFLVNMGRIATVVASKLSTDFQSLDGLEKTPIFYRYT